MMDHIKHFVEYMKEIAPFYAMAGTTGVNPNKVLTQRLLEMLIFFAATAGMIYGIMTTKFEVVEKSIIEIKQDIKDLRKDLYVPRNHSENRSINKGNFDGNTEQSSDTFYYASARPCCPFFKGNDADKVKYREINTPKNVFP